MNDQDHRIRQLLLESLDAELGDRLHGPTDADRPGTARPDSGRSGAARRWALPAAAAAVVIAAAAGAVALTGNGNPSPSGATAGTIVTCAPTGTGSASRDTSILLSRAAGLTDGTASVARHGRLVEVRVPQATRHDVANLCASTSLALRPVIAPAVPVTDRAATRTHPLAHLGFPAPTTETAYDRLTATQQRKISSRLASTDCVHPSAAASTPGVVCGRGIAYLVGATVLDGTSVTSAQAQAPGSAGTTTDVAWSVRLSFDRHGAHSWSQFTRQHHAGQGSTVDATDTNCSSTTVPCEDFVAFVSNGRVIAAPLTTAALSSQTQISGNYTKAAAHRLAAALRNGQLPVPLRVLGIRPLR